MAQTRFNPYLTFNGNAREVLTFYKDCIGGELTLQTIGESPIADQMPPDKKNSIMHGMLRNGNMTIMASDMGSPDGTLGNTLSLMLDCASDEEGERYFKKLAAGGKVRDAFDTK